MDRFPVGTRTQRRLEHRQMVLMIVLVTAITIASFFLGVMVGERNSDQQVELAYQTAAQLAPPPGPTGVAAGSQRMTFYEDLPKGNAAPLGSGINLPKGGYAPPPPPPAAGPSSVAAPEPPTPATASQAPVAAAPAPVTVAKSPPAGTAAKAPTPVPPPAAPKASSGGKMVVQIASTKNQAEAKQMVDKLRNKGFAVRAERADLGKKGVWYRVVAGPYADKAAADKAAAQLKKQNYSAIVRSP